MQNRSYVQLIGILVAIGVFLWLSVKGFNSSTSHPTATAQTIEGPVSEAIVGGDISGVQTFVAMQEMLDMEERKIGDLVKAYQFLTDKGVINNDQKVRFARLKIQYATEDQDVMQGVRTLLGVIREDSNNIAALEVLGEMSVKSGQLEKAKERYQKLLTLQPENDGYRDALNSIESTMDNSEKPRGPAVESEQKKN